MLFNPVTMPQFKEKKSKSKGVGAWKAKKEKHTPPSIYVETKVEKRKS